jgi:AmmeMemoRadiSam system protein A
MTDALRGHYGAFVTLKRKDRLRGCVGQVTGTGPLWALVRELATLAALKDPRFTAVKREELDRVAIEISVLGGVERVGDPEDIEIGRHGVIVQKGSHRGLLLPQVATEEGWDTRTFLRRTCQKADLPPDAWQEPDARIYRFTATVFGEEQGHL